MNYKQGDWNQEMHGIVKKNKNKMRKDTDVKYSNIKTVSSVKKVHEHTVRTYTPPLNVHASELCLFSSS